jgi:hypothetical protein
MPRAYFADYEAYEDGHAFAWGQAVLRCAVEDDAEEIIASDRRPAWRTVHRHPAAQRMPPVNVCRGLRHAGKTAPVHAIV